MAGGTEIKRRPKRLIVCCDGTWQSSVALKRNIPSNVTRLARSFARTDERDPDNVWDQVVYYNAGIGTGEISTVEAVRQGSVGAGFSGDVLEAYNFLVLNYTHGDKIYCFGFSRGAYTARAVAGLVNDIGIINPRDMQDFPELYQHYEWPEKEYNYDTTQPNWFRKSHYYRQWVNGVPIRIQDGENAFIEGSNGSTALRLWEQYPHERSPEASRQVEVVGVFDTVGSLGVPDTAMHSFNLVKKGIRWMTNGGTAPGFHNVDLSIYTRHAFHALALDEHRRPFSPTLWHLPLEERRVDERTHDQIEDAYWKAGKEVDRLLDESLDFTRDEIKKDPKKLDPLKKAWTALMDSGTDFANGKNSRYYLEDSELEQVWFPGYHINIGGGSDDALETRKGDLEQIALISFAWMCDKIKPYLKFEDKLRKRTVGDRMAMINPILAEIQEGGNKDYGQWKITKGFWKTIEAVQPWYKTPQKKVEDGTTSGWATGPIIDSYGVTYIPAGSTIRSPGRYLTDDVTKKEAGATNERIHPCIPYRMEMVKDYKPEALKDFKRIYHNGKWLWVRTSVLQGSPGQWTFPEKGQGNCVEELEVNKKPLKFSFFMAKDHLKYLDQLVIQIDRIDRERNRDKDTRALAKEKKAAEKAVAAGDEICVTTAMDFLQVTKKGEYWKAADHKPNGSA